MLVSGRENVFRVGDDILHSYMGIYNKWLQRALLNNQDLMESKTFFFVAHLNSLKC